MPEGGGGAGRTKRTLQFNIIRRVRKCIAHECIHTHYTHVFHNRCVRRVGSRKKKVPGHPLAFRLALIVVLRLSRGREKKETMLRWTLMYRNNNNNCCCYGYII